MPPRLSKKEFLDSLEQFLASATPSELRDALRAVALELPLSERQAFLTRIGRSSSAAKQVAETLSASDLLASVDDLVDELQEMMSEPEDPDDSYGDDDGLGPYRDLVGRLSEAIDETVHLFDRGDFSDALAVFERLFDLFDLEDAFGRGIAPSDIPDLDWREAKARYLAAVYLTTTPAKRPDAILAALSPKPLEFDLHRPSLADLFRFLPKKTGGREEFLRSIIDTLKNKTPTKGGLMIEVCYLDQLLREAVFLADGVEGLATLARTDGKRHPKAFLDWFAELERTGDHQTLVREAASALVTLERGTLVRARVADFLVCAARAVGAAETVKHALWEGFTDDPEILRLLALREVDKGEQRLEAMLRAAAWIEEECAKPKTRERFTVWDEERQYGAPPDATIALHARLLGGDPLGALQRIEAFHRNDDLGKPRDEAFLAAFCCGFATGKPVAGFPEAIRDMWQETLISSLGRPSLPFESEDRRSFIERLNTAYSEILTRPSPDRLEVSRRLLRWVKDWAERFAITTVSETRRSLYDTVALRLAACREAYAVMGCRSEVDALIETLQSRFSRQRAFLEALQLRVGGKMALRKR